MRKIGVLLVNMLCLVLYTGKAFSQDVRLYPVAEVVRALATSFEPGTTDYVVIMQHALMARGRIRNEKQFREEIGKSGALGKVRLETVNKSSGDSSESEVFNVTAEMQSRNLVEPKATRSRFRNEAELSALVQGVLEGSGCTAISQHSKSGYGSGSFVVKYRWRCPSTVLEVASLIGKLESDSAGLALDHLGIHAGRKMENGGDAIDVAFDALVNIGVEG